jgi:PEP-CTERM putative exosortase interaction domain
MRFFWAFVLSVIALDAAAVPIEYSFRSTVDGLSPGVEGLTGVKLGDEITGGFIFDDAAPRTSYEVCSPGCNYDGTVFYPGVGSESTYDATNMMLWAIVGDRVLTSRGTSLTIRDAPQFAYSDDLWKLETSALDSTLGGLPVSAMQIILQEWFRGPLLSSDLQVSNPADWYPISIGHTRFNISLTDGLGVGSNIYSITKTVPEPGTLVLLASGLAGAWLLRRRRVGLR